MLVTCGLLVVNLILMLWDVQSDSVRGEISLTCDAWQASNTDGYFAVTGHWIEEPRPGILELHSALLGFTRLNNAHNGKRLGGALFKIVNRLGIAHKVQTFNYIGWGIRTDSFHRLGMLPVIMLQTTTRWWNSLLIISRQRPENHITTRHDVLGT